ncbi:MAG: hypothetical protein KGN76_01190 [Acidobacteriota bacterium]|nr:hypothetical protein [Acidobacteriota bacterium]
MGTTSETAPAAVNEVAVARLVAEYLEMPGLRLTLGQAGRLMGLPEAECARALDVLTRAGFLMRSADGRYGRAGDGPLPLLPIPGLKPMAKAAATVKRPPARTDVA